MTSSFFPLVALHIAAALLGAPLVTSPDEHALSHQRTKIELAVPYYSQMPDNVRELPWSEACEETSMTMIANYHRGTQLSIEEFKERILMLVNWENEHLGVNEDTSADQIIEMIDAHETFAAAIQSNPTLDDLRTQIQLEQPVIALVDWFSLRDRYDLERDDSFHVLVIVGYDDVTQEFITHDPSKGPSTRYSYEHMMRALHDYDASTREADGTPTVIYTAP